MAHRHLEPIAFVVSFFAVLLPLWTAPAAAAAPRSVEKAADATAVLATDGASSRRLGYGRLETLTAQTATSWLVTHAPPAHTLPEKGYLKTNSEFALKARLFLSDVLPAVPQDLFLSDVLPYQHFDEHIDAWREPFYKELTTIAQKAGTLKEVVEAVFPAAFTMLGAKDRKVEFKSNLTPQMMAPISQTIANGHASCTGLSILVADALRSVGVPARVVGTAVWNREAGGNHNWVEAWTGEGSGDGWHFFDADPAGLVWDKAWFTDGTVQLATTGEHGIQSPVWDKNGDASYELTWRDPLVSSPAIDRTAFYKKVAVSHGEGGDAERAGSR